MLDINRLLLVMFLAGVMILLTACGSDPDTAPPESSQTGTSYTDNLAEQLDAAGQAAEEMEAASRRQEQEAQRVMDEAGRTR